MKQPNSPETSVENFPILVLQPRDKAVMLGEKTKKFSKNLHDKTVQFPAEENVLILSTNMAAVTSVANQ